MSFINNDWSRHLLPWNDPCQKLIQQNNPLFYSSFILTQEHFSTVKYKFSIYSSFQWYMFASHDESVLKTNVYRDQDSQVSFDDRSSWLLIISMDENITALVFFDGVLVYYCPTWLQVPVVAKVHKANSSRRQIPSSSRTQPRCNAINFCSNWSSTGETLWVRYFIYGQSLNLLLYSSSGNFDKKEAGNRACGLYIAHRSHIFYSWFVFSSICFLVNKIPSGNEVFEMAAVFRTRLWEGL